MAITGDYIGFSFNGIHSSDLGIFRSQKGLSKTNLLPNFKDKTSSVDGVNETYYFYTQIEKREFTIDFAFSQLTESQMRKLQTTFRPNLIGELIFDETPYKYYQAKVSAAPNIEYVPFEGGNNDEGGRYYNGNGSIKFVCYYPYARSRFKTLPSGNAKYDNQDEWAKASGILTSEVYEEQRFDEGYIPADSSRNRIVNLYNPGDMDSSFTLEFSTHVSGTLQSVGKIELYSSDGTTDTIIGQLLINTTGLTYSHHFKLDSRANLLTSHSNNKPNDWVLSNDKIISGDFFNISTTTETIHPMYLKLTNLHCTSTTCIYYDYLYY